MGSTSYGWKREGNSHFVIVAPHGAMHDDDYTDELADIIADLLDAYVVVNDTYVKPTNPDAKTDGSNVENFNRLKWTGTHYSWNTKKPAMKEFYEDISTFCDEARGNCDYDRAVIIYVHGMMDEDDVGIDIGCGARFHKGELKGTQGGLNTKHPSAKLNTGVVRARREHMLALKDNLEQHLEDAGHEFSVGIGEAKRSDKDGKILRFTAWSRWNGVQYHAGSEDVSFQLEITRSLRDDLEETGKIIADSVANIYG